MSLWPQVNPGAMRHRIRVLGPVATTDESGAAVVFEEVLTTYAEVEEDEGGREANTPGQVTAEETLKLKTWFDARIKSNMQLETDHGRWIIKQAINVRKMNVAMRLICVALGGDE
jgi:head-tail adaptor